MTSANNLKAKNDKINQGLSLDGKIETISRFYNSWTPTYDADVAEEGYCAPKIIASIVKHYGIAPTAKLLDAGCGTGLLGSHLAKLGYQSITGFDISANMVSQARARGCYERLLTGLDLNQPLTDLATEFALIASSGVYTLGHVPPNSLLNLINVCQPGGLILISTRHSYVQSSGFDQFVANLDSDNIIAIENIYTDTYTNEENASYWVLRRVNADS